MTQFKNSDKIVDIFVDKMIASRWDGPGSATAPISALANVLAVEKDLLEWGNAAGTNPDDVEGGAQDAYRRDYEADPGHQRGTRNR